MTGYIFSLIGVAVFAVIIFLFLCFFSLSTSGESVEILIDGNTSEENLEMLIRSAVIVADKYLVGARIYIQGGDDSVVNMFCKNYGILRKE